MRKTYYSGAWYLTITDEGEEKGKVFCYYDYKVDQHSLCGCPLKQIGSINEVLNVLKRHKKIDESPKYEALRSLNADKFKMYDDFIKILKVELNSNVA